MYARNIGEVLRTIKGAKDGIKRCYYLIPIYDGKKSFYNKALVTELNNGELVLTSYVTDVCRITKDGDFIKTWDGYSATTARHVNEFRRQNGLSGIAKKDWDALQAAF